MPTLVGIMEGILDNKTLAMKIGQIVYAKKGENVTLVDISERSSFADFFVNVTASNERMLSAMADEVDGKMEKEEGITPKNIEGTPSSGWILVDYGDIIINLFLPAQRELYQIEKIWADGEIINIE